MLFLVSGATLDGTTASARLELRADSDASPDTYRLYLRGAYRGYRMTVPSMGTHPLDDVVEGGELVADPHGEDAGFPAGTIDIVVRHKQP